jgi:hypothetical protein
MCSSNDNPMRSENDVPTHPAAIRLHRRLASSTNSSSSAVHEQMTVCLLGRMNRLDHVRMAARRLHVK